MGRLMPSYPQRSTPVPCRGTASANNHGAVPPVPGVPPLPARIREHIHITTHAHHLARTDTFSPGTGGTDETELNIKGNFCSRQWNRKQSPGTGLIYMD